jgi:hypothetical protein
MKITRASNCSGGVLIAAMIFVLMVASCLVSYLLLVQNSNLTVSRAQQWNSALAVAEAGIEEAMAKLNTIPITTNTTSTNFTLTQLGFNGGQYSVVNSGNGPTNVITSTATVSAPITGASISRTVRVTAAREGLFTKGIISMTDITMNGNGVAVDSYNSALGPYNPANPVGLHGDVAALDGIVDLGNHTIDGNLYLGPDATFPRGTVTGNIYNDWNMQIPPPALPTFDDYGNPITWTPAPTSTGVTTKGNQSVHDFTTGGYYIINDSYPLVVEPGVTVTLDVKVNSYTPSDVTINGGTTNSGTVLMYQESGSLTFSGSGDYGAASNQPKNFVYFGMAGVTSISVKMSGSSSFTGVIYAPQAVATFSGGGSGNNIMGSMIVKQLTLNGGYNIHYDSSLNGYYYGFYVVGSWQEL